MPNDQTSLCSLPTTEAGFWLAKLLPLSINRRLINKNELNDIEAYKEGFEAMEITAVQLADMVKQGYAYAPQMRGVRKATNFLRSGIISLDIDGDVSPDVLFSQPLVEQCATVVYTTVNHTRDKPRYRIIFALEHPFEDAEAFRAANEAIALRLGGDPSVVDAGRLFFGNTNAKAIVRDRGLPLAMLEELVAQRIQFVRQEMSTERDIGVSATTTSQLRLSPDTLIRTKHSGEIRLQDIEPPAPLFCPMHADDNPSAFVVVSRSGQKGIHCSKCAATFWPVWEGASQTSFDDAVKRVLDFSIKHEDRGPLASFEQDVLADGTFRPSDDYLDMVPNLHRARVTLLKDEFLTLTEQQLSAGVTYIKSPKGTSKTGALETILRDSGKKVLVIGHRKALLRQMAARFQINCYLPDGERYGGVEQHRYAVSLDSLSKVNTAHQYDFLVLDESEQVLAHMLSETMVSRRNRALRLLQHFAKTAKHVVALDADLSWPTFRFLSRCKGHDQASVILNEFTKPRGVLNLFADPPQFAEELMRKIAKGGRCYVTSNRKKMIDDLCAAISSKFPDLKLIKITSENSMTDEVQQLLRHTKLAADYDVILASPSVSTGVDFTFDKPIFHVFGHFAPLTLNHFECDQQISRVRAPLSVNIFIDESEFEYETNLEVVRHDLLESRLADGCIRGLNADGSMIYDPADPLLDLAGSVETVRRASVNRLKKNFCAYREAEGWTINELAPNIGSRTGAEILVLGKELANEEYYNALMTAPQVSASEANELELAVLSNQSVTYDKMRALRRYQMERFYNKPISREIIFIDDSGRTRDKVMLFERATSPSEWSISHHTLALELSNPAYIRLLRHPKFRVVLMVRVLELAGLLDECGLVRDAVIEKDGLGELVAFMTEHQIMLETAFEAPFRKDFKDDPIRNLNEKVLDRIGIGVKKFKNKVICGRKHYYYRLDKERLRLMEEICSGRPKPMSLTPVQVTDRTKPLPSVGVVQSQG